MTRASVSMTPADLDPLYLATAIEATLRAGEMQMASLGRVDHVGHKGPIDLVTDVDVAVERMFRDLIGRRFPDHAILAEELQGDHDAARAAGPLRWVFDPIDGTTNYAHGLPFFCSAAALEIEGETVVGAVFEPVRRELYAAEVGGGAFLNGRPLRVAAPTTLVNALLCTGFPYDVHDTLDEVVGLFRAFVGRARGVRRLGSAALDLCYLAAGRLDGFWEQRLHPWDVSAASVIVREAGGRVTDWDGQPYRSARHDIVASSGALHAELLQVIADFTAGRTE